jgi:hypothetical protein
MACVGCQQRREAIKAMAGKVGAIVFGGRKRKLADSFLVDEGKKGDPAGLDPAAPDPGIGAGVAAPGGDAGAAGEAGTSRGSNGGGGY